MLAEAPRAKKMTLRLLCSGCLCADRRKLTRDTHIFCRSLMNDAFSRELKKLRGGLFFMLRFEGQRQKRSSAINVIIVERRKISALLSFHIVVVILGTPAQSYSAPFLARASPKIGSSFVLLLAAIILKMWACLSIMTDHFEG